MSEHNRKTDERRHTFHSVPGQKNIVEEKKVGRKKICFLRSVCTVDGL